MREKKSLILLSLFMIFLLSIGISQAAILMENPKGTYNLGEDINFQATVTSADSFNGFIKIQIFCYKYDPTIQTHQLVYYSPIILEANKNKKISFNYLADVAGRCYFESDLETVQKTFDVTRTDEFKVSDSANITLNKNKEQFRPGEEIKVEGAVIKENGKNFEGILSLDLEAHYDFPVNDGKFSFSLSLSKNIKSYNHEIAVSARDNSSNTGKSIFNFYVIPVPTSISVNSSNTTVVSGKSITISPVLYDQGNDPLNGTILIAIYNKDKLIFARDVNSTSSITYQFEYSAVPGVYQIKSNYESFEEDKNITVLPHYELEAKIENGTLTLTNTGNVLYDKPILILFNFSEQHKTFNSTITPNLETGKSSTYALEAPRGNYTISLVYPTESDYKEQKFPEQFLTGSIIATTALNKPLIQGNVTSYAIILVVFVVLILVLLMGVMRKKSGNFNYSKYDKSEYKEIKPRIMSESEVQLSQKPIESKEQKFQPGSSNPKPRVFENKFTSNSLKPSEEKKKDIEKLRADSQWYIQRSLRKEGY